MHARILTGGRRSGLSCGERGAESCHCAIDPGKHHHEHAMNRGFSGDEERRQRQPADPAEGEGALSRDEPVHDFSSHTADSLRTLAEAHRAGFISFEYTAAEVRPHWFPKIKRRGLKPMRI